MVGLPGDESACNAGDLSSVPVRKIPWRRKWQPTPVFLPGEFQAQRSLEGYSPWDCKELDTTKQLKNLGQFWWCPGLDICYSKCGPWACNL